MMNFKCDIHYDIMKKDSNQGAANAPNGGAWPRQWDEQSGHTDKYANSDTLQLFARTDSAWKRSVFKVPAL